MLVAIKPSWLAREAAGIIGMHGWEYNSWQQAESFNRRPNKGLHLEFLHLVPLGWRTPLRCAFSASAEGSQT